jgi:hypothetical protein
MKQDVLTVRLDRRDTQGAIIDRVDKKLIDQLRLARDFGSALPSAQERGQLIAKREDARRFEPDDRSSRCGERGQPAGERREVRRRIGKESLRNEGTAATQVALEPNAMSGPLEKFDSGLSNVRLRVAREAVRKQHDFATP